METDPDHRHPSASASWTGAAERPGPDADHHPTDPADPGCLMGSTTAIEDTRPIPARLVIYSLAVLGGLGGIVAAILQEVQSVGLFTVILIAPAVEEVCKPLGVIFMLEKRPRWIRAGGEVVLMSVLGALTFATVENAIYIFAYHPNGSAAFIAWRLIVCTGMHVAASAIMGIGLARTIRHRKPNRAFSIDQCLWYYVAAVALHGAYNATAYVLETTGVLTF